MPPETTYSLPDLSDLADALHRKDRHLAVGGITPGARGLVLASLTRVGWPESRQIIVTPRRSEAEEAAAVLELLCPGVRVGVVPSDTAAVYQGVEPPLASRLALVRLLEGIARDAVDVVVIPARSLLANLPQPASIADATLRLDLGFAGRYRRTRYEPGNGGLQAR